jgi:hypothetical protein
LMPRSQLANLFAEGASFLRCRHISWSLLLWNLATGECETEQQPAPVTVYHMLRSFTALLSRAETYRASIFLAVATTRSVVMPKCW